MKIIKLTGRLGKEFGDSFELDIVSPAEAVRALCVQIPGLEDALKEGIYRVRKVYENYEEALEEDDLTLGMGKAHTLVIEPVVTGSKKRGLGKIIIGVFLVAAAFVIGPLTGAAWGSSVGAAGTALGGVTYANLALAGVALAVSGVSALLTPQVDTPQNDDQKQSHFLDLTGNLIEQGNPVPIVFGECFVGSVVISAGVSSEQMLPISITNRLINYEGSIE